MCVNEPGMGPRKGLSDGVVDLEYLDVVLGEA